LPFNLEVRDRPIYGVDSLLIGCVTCRDLYALVTLAPTDHVGRSRAEVTSRFLIDALA